MRVGMNMLLWGTDLSGEQHLPLFERLKAMGYDGVELPLIGADPARIAGLARRLDDIGLARTGVTVTGAEANLISADSRIRRAGIDAVDKALECCAAAEISVLVGPFYSALGVFSGAAPTTTEWQYALDGIREISQRAQRMGVVLGLEYLNRFENYLLNCAADTVRFVRDVDRPNCRMMIDTFHAHIEEKRVGDAIRESADVLVHVHVSENDRSTPGTGQVAWAEIFAALHGIEYRGWLTVEAFGMRHPTFARATSIWRRMFTSEEHVASDALSHVRAGWAAAATAVAAPETAHKGNRYDDNR